MRDSFNWTAFNNETPKCWPYVFSTFFVCVGVLLLSWLTWDAESFVPYSLDLDVRIPTKVFWLSRTPRILGSVLQAACCIRIVVDHRGRLERKNLLHYYTCWYAAFVGINGVMSPFRDVNTCSCLNAIPSAIFKGINAICFLSFVSAKLAEIWLVIIRLEMMQQQVVACVIRVLCLLHVIPDLIFALSAIWPDTNVSHAMQSSTSALLMISGFLIYTAAVVAMLHAIQTAKRECSDSYVNVEMQDKLRSAVRWSSRTAIWIGASGTTTFLVGSLFQLMVQFQHDEKSIVIVFLLTQIALLADTISSSMCVLSIGGFVGLRLDAVIINLALVGRNVLDERAQKVRKDLRCAAMQRSNSISALAAMITLNNKSADQVFNEAVHQFRCVSWDDLTYDVFVGNGLGQDCGTLIADYYSLSRPAQFGDCDAFLSHSWHDDVDAKWCALSEWSSAFQRKHGRSPTFWLDKVCIDQMNISQGLQCLPVFLAACNSLLILSGTTYTSRLWCILELYVFFSMRKSNRSHCGEVHLKLIGKSSEFQSTFDAWQHFQVVNCSCSNSEDREQIMSVIEQHQGGTETFNTEVTKLMQEIRFRAKVRKAIRKVTPQGRLFQYSCTTQG